MNRQRVPNFFHRPKVKIAEHHSSSPLDDASCTMDTHGVPRSFHEEIVSDSM